MLPPSRKYFSRQRIASRHRVAMVTACRRIFELRFQRDVAFCHRPHILGPALFFPITNQPPSHAFLKQVQRFVPSENISDITERFPLSGRRRRCQTEVTRILLVFRISPVTDLFRQVIQTFQHVRVDREESPFGIELSVTPIHQIT
jgi:hypothetical protein